MEIKLIPSDLTVCKISDTKQLDLNKSLYFIGKTDEEVSLVCPTEDAPEETITREDGWKGFRIEGVLDFSLVGILAQITTILAKQQISIFAISTYNTDYILVKKEAFEKALEILSSHGYKIIPGDD